MIKMGVKFFLLLAICLCVFGCGDEGVLLNDLVPLAPERVTLGPPPPELQELLWGPSLNDLIGKHHESMKGWDLEGHGGKYPLFYIEKIVLRVMRERYYTKYIDAGGVAVIGNDVLPNRYFYATRELILEMTAKHPEIRKHLTPTDEERVPPPSFDGFVFTHLPTPTFAFVILDTEAPILPETFPRYRGSLGLCSPSLCNAVIGVHSDRILLSVVVHEFAHAMHFAIASMIDPTFDDRLKAAYAHAKNNPKSYWSDFAAAMKNRSEYWAFAVNKYCLEFLGPHFSDEQNHIRFRERDPLLYELLEEWLPRKDLSYIEEKSY